MQYVIYAYLLVFFISVIANSVLWIRAKASVLLLIYEIIAALYLISVTLIYFTPSWMESVNILFCLPVIPFIIVDVYMTCWGKDEWICPPAFQHNANDLELARIAAVAFASPAYISAVLFLIQKAG